MTKKTNSKKDTTVIVALITVFGAVVVAIIANIVSPLIQQHIASTVVPTATEALTPIVTNRNLLQKIDFSYYPDLPTQHGWQTLDSTPVTFTTGLDGYEGNHLIIESNPLDGEYGIDTPVNQEAIKGTVIEFVGKFSQDSAVYVHVWLKSQNGAASYDGWLQFLPGSTQYTQIAPNEWMVNVEPTPKNGGWTMLRVDVPDAVKQTFGIEGWKYNHIDIFRVRGNIWLASISVFE